MSDLNLTIRNIKNISQCDMELPLEKGLYAFVGENGCGKSTLMLAISLLVKPSSRKSFLPYDIKETSSVDFTVDEVADHWCVIDGELTTASQKGGRCITNNRYHGFYEGSIFYGSRFYDYNLVESFLKKPQFPSLIRPADSFVSETLSYVLHGDKNHYTELYKIKDKKLQLIAVLEAFHTFLRAIKTILVSII